MNRKRIIFFSCLAIAAMMLLCLVVAGRVRRPASSQRASVGFLGFTNVPTKGRYAIFSLTNTADVPTAFLVDSFEEPMGGVWTRRALTNATGLTAQGGAWMRGFLDWQNSLEPGKTAVFYLPAPITNSSWRACFTCRESEPMDLWRSFCGTATPTSALFRVNRNTIFFRYQVFSGKEYKIFTPEVSR